MANCKKCNAPIELKQGRRPREFCDNNQKCRNEWFRKNKKAKTQSKTVKLPDDYANWKNVGILKSDGTVEELKDISQLPEHMKLSLKGIQDLTIPTNVVEPVKPLGSKQTNTVIKSTGTKTLTPYEEILKKKRGF